MPFAGEVLSLRDLGNVGIKNFPCSLGHAAVKVLRFQSSFKLGPQSKDLPISLEAPC